MKRFRKIIKIVSLTGLFLIALLLAGSVVFKERVTGLVISGINKKLVKPIHTGSVNFSLLRRFPNAFAELEDLVIISPVSDDTLLRAANAELSLNIPGLIRGELQAGKLVLTDGSVRLVKDAGGTSNHIFWKENEQEGKVRGSKTVELKSVRLSRMAVSFKDMPAGVTVMGNINDVRSRIVANGDSLAFNLDGEIILDSVKTRSGSFVNKRLSLKSAANFSISDSAIRFNDIKAVIHDQDITMSGIIFRHGDNGGNLIFDSKNLIIADALRHLPAATAEKLQKYSADGTARMKLSIELAGKGKTGSFISEASVSNGKLVVPGKELGVTGISADLSVSGSTGKNPPSYDFRAKSVSGKLNGRDFKGSVLIKGEKNPFIDITYLGSVELSEMTGKAEESGIKNLTGNARVSLHLHGQTASLKPLSAKKLFDLNPAININLKSVSFEHNSLKYPVKELSGNIMVAQNAWFDELSFTYGGSHAIMNGMFSGLSQFVNDRSAPAILAGAIWVDRLNLDLFSYNGPEKKDTVPDKPAGIGNLSINLNIQTDSLSKGAFGASMFSGNLVYSNGLLNIKQFRMNTLSGLFEGNAALLKMNGGYTTRGWFDLNSIDINQAFRVFKNFGQEHLLAGNIKGKLTGSIGISLSSDKDFKPDINSLSVTGNWIIRNGELVNFEPLYSLSRFINLEELKDVTFSEMKNDLLIKNQTLTIPSMDISSSAFSLKVSGEQHFKGEYDYRINLSLSELLSSKARENNTGFTEFGLVEDDNLGNTTVFLKLTGEPGNSNINWDMGATGKGIAADIKEEKAVIRNILKEEYGWFKKDSSVSNTAKGSKRFSIEWEEVDSISRIGGKEEQKRLTLPKILKKKRKK